MNNNQSNPINGVLNFTNTNKIGQIKSMLDQEAKTVLSFYSTLSNKQGNLMEQLGQLSSGSNKIDKNNQIVQSLSNNVITNSNRIKNTINDTVNKINSFSPKNESLLFAVSKGQVQIAETLIKN